MKFTKSFDRKIQDALDRIGTKISQDANRILVQESGKNDLAAKYTHKVEGDSVKIFNPDKNSLYVEYGTGPRGEESFRQYFNERKPNFSALITPKKGKVLHWKNEKGQDVFAASTRGMSAYAPLRRAAFQNRKFIKDQIKKL